MNVVKESDPSEERKRQLGVDQWATWTKEESTFDWSYEKPETCYVLQGAFSVDLPGGETVSAAEGDLVKFPAGLSCTWTVERDLKKVYTPESLDLNGRQIPVD